MFHRAGHHRKVRAMPGDHTSSVLVSGGSAAACAHALVIVIRAPSHATLVGPCCDFHETWPILFASITVFILLLLLLL